MESKKQTLDSTPKVNLYSTFLTPEPTSESQILLILHD